jgi:two-component system chemotaxis sensor kinase CheA
MSIDMAQFHQVFFEESFEGLEIMENGLMALTPGIAEAELIDSIFRAAHSIKGGAGTFGFAPISDFTHALETLLDQMRDGTRAVSTGNIDILLRSVDCLKHMLEAAQKGTEADADQVQRQQAELLAELAADPEPTIVDNTEAQSSVVQNDATRRYIITFTPEPQMLQTANDPLPLFRELRELGELEVEADWQRVPDFTDLQPEDCYLGWQLTITTEADEERLREVFAWVDDISALDIQAESKLATDPAQAMATPGTRAAAEESASNPQQAVTSIRVETGKIDTLINMVGELVITQSMLSTLGEQIEDQQQLNQTGLETLLRGLKQLERNTRELQESVMQVRMMPISFSFARFPRLVRDLSARLGKKIELQLQGESTELDKTVIEKIVDPMVHLVRNSIDHGIEMPEDRLAAGKPETGFIELNAYHEGGNIVIEINDDGRGMDRDRLLQKGIEKGLLSEQDVLSDQQIYELIFMPGFSTADVVSDVSGRGVGMDVVRRNIHQLGGGIEIDSELGEGTSMIIRLPLTLAILDGQTVQVGSESFIIPIVSIIESLQIQPEMLYRVGGKGETIKLRGEYIPIIRLHEIFSLESERKIQLDEGLLVVVEADGQAMGLFVDDLLGQQQVVIKSLETNYKKIDGFAGATVLGNGAVALILDIPGIVRLNQLRHRKVRAA